MAGYQPRHDTDPVWFNGTQVNSLTVASAQTGVRITAVYGWDERPDVRDVRELRSGQDGEYADNLYLGGRTITLEGEVYGSSWVNLQSRKRTLAALFVPSSDEVLLKIPDPATASPTAVYASTGMTGYERVMCRVVEAIQFGDTLDPMCQVFQVILRASDPRVYSDTETSTDSGTSGTASRTVTVDQGGTYETLPTLTVTGPTGSDFTVTEPSSGLSLALSGLTMTADEQMIVGVRERTIDALVGYERSRLIFDTGGASIVSLWMLDETSGTTADNSEGTAARDGTYTGGYTLNQSGPLSGVASIALNGSTGYVSIPNVAALYPTRVLYEQWIRLDTVSGTQTAIDGITSNRGFRIDVSGTSARLTVGSGGFTTTGTLSAVTLAINTWYRVVAWVGSGTTYNGNGLIVYDSSGNKLGQTLLSTTYSPSTSGGYRIGSTLAGASFLDGFSGPAALYDLGGVYYYGDPPGTLDEYVSAYTYLDASASAWANLGTGSSVYTLASSGLNTGSKLNVTYRDARL